MNSQECLWRKVSCKTRVPILGSLIKKMQAAELETTELKMLRWSMGVIRLDEITNEYLRGTADLQRFGEKLREARLDWCGHSIRKDI